MPGFRDRFVLTDSIDRLAGLYSLRSDEVAALLVYRDSGAGQSPSVAGPQERLRREFTGLGSAVDRLLELCPEHPYDDVVAQVVMAGWCAGRSVLVGDASGAVSLLAGQGGSLAIAGAALLGDVLGPVTTTVGIGPALADFERRWRPAVGWRRPRGGAPRRRSSSPNLPGIDRLVASRFVGKIAKKCHDVAPSPLKA